jgi:hypothetical protein
VPLPLVAIAVGTAGRALAGAGARGAAQSALGGSGIREGLKAAVQDAALGAGAQGVGAALSAQQQRQAASRAAANRHRGY